MIYFITPRPNKKQPARGLFLIYEIANYGWVPQEAASVGANFL